MLSAGCVRRVQEARLQSLAMQLAESHLLAHHVPDRPCSHAECVSQLFLETSA